MVLFYNNFTITIVELWWVYVSVVVRLCMCVYVSNNFLTLCIELCVECQPTDQTITKHLLVYEFLIQQKQKQQKQEQ